MTSNQSQHILDLHAELCALGDHIWRLETLEEYKARLGIPKDTQASVMKLTFICHYCHSEKVTPPEQHLLTHLMGHTQ